MIDRTRYFRLVENARKLTLGLRPNQLTIRTRTWSGTYANDGTATDSDLVLPKHYKIRSIEGEEVLGSGGIYELHDLVVDGITPRDPLDAAVGYLPSQLVPPCPTPNVEVIYIITGEHPGEYQRIALRSVRAFRHTLYLRRRVTASTLP